MIFQMLFLKICTFTFSIIMKKIGTWNLIIKIGATNSRMSSITKGRLRIQMTFIIWRTSWWVGQYIPREEEPNVYLCETKNVKGLEWTKTEMENAKMLPLWPLWSHCFRKDITRGTLSECCVQGDMKKDSCHGKGKNSYNTNKQIKKKKVQRCDTLHLENRFWELEYTDQYCFMVVLKDSVAKYILKGNVISCL